MSKVPHIDRLKAIIRLDPGNHWIEKIKRSELSASEKKELLDFVNPPKKDLTDVLTVGGDTGDLSDMF
ncbi:MAG: hypothetical protein OIF32_06670 [Campylobacterales bacterium]|nr:hypothetical protein [Campylobacterales bacterium]